MVSQISIVVVPTLICFLALLLFITMLFLGRGFWALFVSGLLLLACGFVVTGLQSHWLYFLSALFGVISLIFGIRILRQNLISRLIMPVMRKVLPKMGETERIALEAGTVWWDAELFSGKPNWNKLLNFQIKDLSAKEKAFLDGPVEEVCKMINDWETIQARDLSPEVWEFLKKHKFFGMIIPEEFGGLGFSALAHAMVVTKLSSRSITAAVTVMVPNSLGPAELLLHYGTKQQKDHYLPRLATGQEIPCFALTGPEAGSDAAATQSVGIICEGVYEGKEVLGIQLNWRKRYITLGPVSTVIGLAFQLKDPDHLLGDQENLGITCALIPSHLPGIDIGKRHDPMGIPFFNGPNEGHDVFVPLDFIIGGQDMAGHGWRMLMESLAVGRSISLPSLSVGGAQLSTRVIGAYATVREQFDTPIGRFEGIEEPMARIGGLTYVANAARLLTLGAIDAGHKPAVISAIVKHYLTEIMRSIVNDAMDIRAGSAICEGPRNLLARLYKAVPIGITVEGANILTRSMIIYGQGAIRCHPFVQAEMQAVAQNNLAKFDYAFFGHVNLVFRNAARAFVLGLTGGRLSHSPVSGKLSRYFKQLNRMSSAFGFVSDVAMGTLGGKLKRREKITGRLADVLGWMYLASAALKKFIDDGQRPGDLPFVQWSCEHALSTIQSSLKNLLDNMPNRFLGCFLKCLIFPLGQRLRPPSDRLGSAVARSLLEDNEERLRLTSEIFMPKEHEPGLGHLEAALDKAVEAIAVETKIRDAVRKGQLDKTPGFSLLDEAFRYDIITSDEREIVLQAKEIQSEVIRVDAFDPDEFLKMRD